MNNKLYQLLLSLKLGDGCYITQNVTENKRYRVSTNSIKRDYVEYKRSILESFGLKTKDIKCFSGYNKNSNMYGITTHVTVETTLVGNMSLKSAIEDLDSYGIILLYLDDGSLHKTKHYMHIYCNSFSIEETNLLIDKIFSFYPQKRCALRFDRKKDGRCFPYVYVPKSVACEMNKDVRDFLISNNIDSLLYKTFLPSQTIESIDS
jgi:hypothetical protein